MRSGLRFLIIVTVHKYSSSSCFRSSCYRYLCYVPLLLLLLLQLTLLLLLLLLLLLRFQLLLLAEAVDAADTATAILSRLPPPNLLPQPFVLRLGPFTALLP